MHWGQQIDLDHEAVETGYPRMRHWRATLTGYLRDDRSGDMFQNQFCNDLGLRPDEPAST